jgi:hypothetical protein
MKKKNASLKIIVILAKNYDISSAAYGIAIECAIKHTTQQQFVRCKIDDTQQAVRKRQKQNYNLL